MKSKEDKSMSRQLNTLLLKLLVESQTKKLNRDRKLLNPLK